MNGDGDSWNEWLRYVWRRLRSIVWTSDCLWSNELFWIDKQLLVLNSNLHFDLHARQHNSFDSNSDHLVGEYQNLKS